MSAITVVRGTVSRIDKAPWIVTTGQNVIGGLTTNFLIGDTPAQMYNLSMLKEGDDVEAAGRLINGVMHALTLRNKSTGTVHYQQSSQRSNMLRWSVLGLFLFSIWAGGAVFILMLPLVIFAAWFVFRSTAPARKANKLLGIG